MKLKNKNLIERIIMAISFVGVLFIPLFIWGLWIWQLKTENKWQGGLKMTNEEEIKKHFEEIIRLCKIAGIIGKSMNVGKHYVSFEFKPRKEICKECGKTI